MFFFPEHEYDWQFCFMPHLKSKPLCTLCWVYRFETEFRLIINVEVKLVGENYISTISKKTQFPKYCIYIRCIPLNQRLPYTDTGYAKYHLFISFLCLVKTKAYNVMFCATVKQSPQRFLSLKNLCTKKAKSGVAALASMPWAVGLLYWPQSSIATCI